MLYENLAPIFSAFIDRLTVNDSYQIKRCVDNAWHEQLNGNAGSQDTAAKQQKQVIHAVIGRMLQSDRDQLVKEIESLT